MEALNLSQDFRLVCDGTLTGWAVPHPARISRRAQEMDIRRLIAIAEASQSGGFLNC